jgi:hypothetical protein
MRVWSDLGSDVVEEKSLRLNVESIKSKPWLLGAE